MRQTLADKAIGSGSALPSRGHPPLTADLREAAELGCSLVGGKAASLGALMSLDLDVPEGFVVTTEAFRRFAMAARLDASECDGEWMPGDVLDAICCSYREMFGADEILMAVRSSGVAEDSATASFAGQFESVLNVQGLDAIPGAIRRAWASQYRPSAAAYRERCGAGEGPMAPMAVVVQRLVASEVAGVLFTLNPLTGREEEYVVEAVLGLGEGLVSGAMDADRYVIGAREGAPREVSVVAKTVRTVAVPGNGVRRLSVPPDTARHAALDAGDLRRLAAAGTRIQEHYGRPMDIEWAIAKHRLHILQARPITSIQFERDIGLWTTADFRDGGVSSSVCSPFMWSLYQHAFQAALPRFMCRLRIRKDADRIAWIRLFFGRPYWNLGGIKETLSRLPGYCERDFDANLGIAPTYEGPGVSTSLNGKTLMRALLVLCSIPLCQGRCLSHIRRFVTEFVHRKARFDLDPAVISAIDDSNFFDLYASLRDFQFETETAYFETVFNTSIANLAFQSAIQAVGSKTGITLDPNPLLGGLLDLSHVRPWKDLHRTFVLVPDHDLAADVSLAAEFAQRWPQHGRKELDIRVPRWPEDIDYVRGIIEQAFAAFKNGSDATAQEQARHKAYQIERGRALTAIGRRPVLRLRFQAAVNRMRRHTWWREEMRDHSSYLYALMRRWSLDAGRRLVAAGRLADIEDIWVLSSEHAVMALRGTVSVAETRNMVTEGRRMMASYRNFEAPGEIGERHSVALDDPGDPVRSRCLSGTPCSSGRAIAPARRVSDLGRAQVLEDGDILVTNFTDPGWTHLFPRLAGVVTETGGILSHAAVISREFGIPAVLGVAGATRHICDGDRVLIDGGRGTVEILEPAA
jgi:pyruvate,water dikinase